MPYFKRMMTLHRLMDQVGNDGGSGGGGGSGGDAGDAAAKAAADKAAAEQKEKDDAAAAAAAAGGDGDGKPKLSDSEAKLLKEVMTKKVALKDAEEKLKLFDGIDPAKARAALQAQLDAEQKALEAKGDWDRLKEQMVAAHTTEKSGLETKLKEAGDELAAARATITELTIGGAFASSTYLKESLNLTPNKARAAYGSHFDFADGGIVAYDKPAGAQNRTQLVGADGNNLNFDEALKKLVDLDPDRDQILLSKIKPGAGSKTSQNAKPFKEPENAGYGAGKIAAALKAAGGKVS